MINTVISFIDSAGIGMSVDFIKMGVAVDLDVAITELCACVTKPNETT